MCGKRATKRRGRGSAKLPSCRITSKDGSKHKSGARRVTGGNRGWPVETTVVLVHSGSGCDLKRHTNRSNRFHSFPFLCDFIPFMSRECHQTGWLAPEILTNFEQQDLWVETKRFASNPTMSPFSSGCFPALRPWNPNLARTPASTRRHTRQTRAFIWQHQIVLMVWNSSTILW